MPRVNKRRRPAESVRRDWPIAVLATIGTGLSAYLAGVKLVGGFAVFCEAGSGCDIVQASRWATFLGVPTAAWGALLYAALVSLAVTGLPPKRWQWAFVLATVAVSFSAYLTGVELFVLRAICPYCVAVALVAVAVFVTLLVRRPPGGGRRSPTRPSRVIITGVVTAVVTIVLSAGVWVARGTSVYAEGLARHLAADGDIFYGAFW